MILTYASQVSLVSPERTAVAAIVAAIAFAATEVASVDRRGLLRALIVENLEKALGLISVMCQISAP